MIKKLFIFLVSLGASFITTTALGFILDSIYPGITTCSLGGSNDSESFGCTPVLPILFLVSILILTTFYFLFFRKVVKNFIFILLFLILLVGLVLSFVFVFHLSRISGGSPGKYRTGQIVLSIKKELLGRDITKADIIVFQNPVSDNQFVGEVIGFPSDQVTDKTYYFNQQKAEGLVPQGFYLVRLNNKETLRLQPISKVGYVVIYP